MEPSPVGSSAPAAGQSGPVGAESGAAKRPADVGILALEVYFPRTYVSQASMELLDGCPGKYTKGLGQVNMAFVDDREDIGSVMLTACRSLLEKYRVDPSAIGRLEVGTESLVDKSKSVKTTLMELFGENGDVEGVTSVNACYGGSAALFNSVAWVESSAWDGRYAMVICGDIAVYEPGPARATSGCGVVAMLVGPDAPLVLEPTRSTHAMDVYDFYKPKSGEYPMVDGRLSQACYLKSLDNCWEGFKRKTRGKIGHPGAAGLGMFDYFCLHSPYHKLPQKGLSRLVYLDFLENPSKPDYQDVGHLWSRPREATYDDREVDAAFRLKSLPLYTHKLLPAAHLNREIGNCYSASIFISLSSLVNDVGADLAGRRIFMFSYGSGSMATLYTIRGRVPKDNTYTLSRMALGLNLKQRLAERVQCTPEQFHQALALRESHEAAPWEPLGPPHGLAKGTFYLVAVDAAYRRRYALKA